MSSSSKNCLCRVTSSTKIPALYYFERLWEHQIRSGDRSLVIARRSEPEEQQSMPGGMDSGIIQRRDLRKKFPHHLREAQGSYSTYAKGGTCMP